eukprot:4177176-Amphidinium_carterae.1
MLFSSGKFTRGSATRYNKGQDWGECKSTQVAAPQSDANEASRDNLPSRLDKDAKIEIPLRHCIHLLTLPEKNLWNLDIKRNQHVVCSDRSSTHAEL